MPEDSESINAERVRRLREDYKELKEEHDELERTVIQMGKDIAALQERITIFNLAQTAFTAIAATVATILGRNS